MRLKLGRFRFLFKTNSLEMPMRWWTLSLGYEGKKFREWKKRLKKQSKGGTS